MSRESTERKLEESALELISEQGILAGLNLREAADRAGVNRGNVYHYFGSRRQLLQSALKRQLQENRPSVAEGLKLGWVERIAWSLSYMIGQAKAVDLTELLVLDGDPDISILPFVNDQLARLREDQAAGIIGADVDIVALNLFLSTSIRGYVMNREHLARESGMSTAELDAKMEQMYRAVAASFLAAQRVHESSPT